MVVRTSDRVKESQVKVRFEEQSYNQGQSFLVELSKLFKALGVRSSSHALSVTLSGEWITSLVLKTI